MLADLGGFSGHDMSDNASLNHIEAICDWAWGELQRNEVVDAKKFKSKFGDSADPTSWNRSVHAIHAMCRNFGVETKLDGASLRRLDATRNDPSALAPFATPRFQTLAERTQKEAIGGLIASFLLLPILKGKTIFLGSGTTILHVGQQMCEEARRTGRGYEQRFVTVNIALAALWSLYTGAQGPPARDVTIPEAVLNTGTFRFTNMPHGTRYPLTVSIVGADGCVYDEQKQEVVFFGNDESVAANTSHFVQNTKHSVMFCLTSSKLELGFALAPNTGPPIAPPKKGVIRVLVTDKPLQSDKRFEMAASVLRKHGWEIVSGEEDWEPVRVKMELGEKTPIELDVV